MSLNEQIAPAVARRVAGASPGEAAAIVAALARFMRDSSAVAPDPPHETSGWLRAARREAVRDGLGSPSGWGGAAGWQ